MNTTRSVTRRLLLSGLIIILILTAAVILDGPPTLTNQVLAKGDGSVMGYYGYYKPYCYPYPYCTFVPIILRQMVR